MIRNSLYTIAILFVFVGALYAQKNASEKPSLPVNEQLFLCLDRNIYTVDEVVHFRIFNVSSKEVKQVGWSEVVEVEIITPEGRSVVGGKFKFSEHGGHGNLDLNRTILSGNYYVRAYTKWMRNQSAQNFFYEGITIVNPYKPDVLLPTVSEKASDEIQADTLMSKNLATFQVSSNSFKPNTFANMTIRSGIPDSLMGSVCVSIVKKGTIKENTLRFDSAKNTSGTIEFIPELRGVAISGKVLNRLDTLPVPYARVWVTLQANETVIRDVMCSDKGEFTIDLANEHGIRNLFINASSTKENVVPMIRIDNDFAFSLLNLPFVPFKITKEELEWYDDLSIKAQLNQFFEWTDSSVVENNSVSDSVESFYGTPNFSLRLQDYISMPALEDYFKELIPMVSIRKTDGKRSFHVAGIYPELSIYDPLLMVDRVQINNVDEILSISPSDLERIEVVVTPFLRGNVTYGGIVHFISKNHDFAKISLPEESKFVSYQLLDSLRESDYEQKVELPVPVVGNCLFWNSEMNFDEENNLSIQFNTGSEPGVYELKLEGVDKSNKPFEYTTDLKVN